jgi:hypothetical protein
MASFPKVDWVLTMHSPDIRLMIHLAACIYRSMSVRKLNLLTISTLPCPQDILDVHLSLRGRSFGECGQQTG